MGKELVLYQPLAIELNNGNDGRGSKWFSSSKVRKNIEQILRLNGLLRMPFEFPVEITLVRVLGKGQRLWDADSKLRGNAKELIDALVACGWFVDDGPKYVKDCFVRQDANRRNEGPFVIVEVRKADADSA